MVWITSPELLSESGYYSDETFSTYHPRESLRSQPLTISSPLVSTYWNQDAPEEIAPVRVISTTVLTSNDSFLSKVSARLCEKKALS